MGVFERFLELVSVAFTEDAVRGIVLVMVTATVCYLAATGRPVESFFATIVGAVFGYYFGRLRTNGTSDKGH